MDRRLARIVFLIVMLLAISVAVLPQPDLRAQAADDHGSDRDTATPIAVPSTTSGEIEVPDNRDYFKFDAVAGEPLIIYTILGTLPDSLIAILGSTTGFGLRIGTDFQDPGEATVTLPAASWVFIPPVDGEYFAVVGDGLLMQPGTYELVIEHATAVDLPSTTHVDLDVEGGQIFSRLR